MLSNLLSRKLSLPKAEDALPGRSQKMTVPAKHHVNGHPLAGPYPAGLEQAVFGLGCFWGAERKFWEAPGVWTTAVGSAGGSAVTPHLRRRCARPDRAPRGRPRPFPPEGDELRGAPEGLLGEPRPDPGHAPG